MSNNKVVASERVVSGKPVYYNDLRIAPWKIDDDDFTITTDRELISTVLDNIKEERPPLVLASADGCRYGDTILIRYDDKTLNIDKPIEFVETDMPSCRVYFQDIIGVWGFFEVAIINDLPFSLYTSYPDTLYRLQKRRDLRINVPDVTRAFFRHGTNLHGDCLVKDISASGMLICAGNIDEKFANNLNISDIALALPRSQFSGKAEGEGHIVLPVVSKGRVVRSFVEQETDSICLGISFRGSSAVMDELDGFAGKIKKGRS
jgi:hypothetical protein